MGQEQTNMGDIAFNLKFTAKSFEREAKRSEKQIRIQKKKVKQAIERGNVEGARIFAQNAIRKKNESLNYYRLSARMDAVASRVDTAVKMQQVTRAMSGVVRGMGSVLQSMDVDRISRVMDKFEQQFDDLDVRTAYMDGAMASSTSTSTPESEVNALMGQIVDEHNLEVSGELGAQMGLGPIAGKEASGAFDADADDLSRRLANLKSGDV